MTKWIKNKKAAAFPGNEVFTCSLCCVLAMWNRYERWFDLDIQPWQEGWRGSGGRLRGVTPSVRTHSSKSLPFLLHTRTCTHTRMHARTCSTHTFRAEMHHCYKRFALNLSSLSLTCAHRNTRIHFLFDSFSPLFSACSFPSLSSNEFGHLRKSGEAVKLPVSFTSQQSRVNTVSDTTLSLSWLVNEPLNYCKSGLTRFIRWSMSDLGITWPILVSRHLLAAPPHTPTLAGSTLHSSV